MPAATLILRTLRNRTTIGWYSGALLIYGIFFAAHLLDPEGTPHFSHVHAAIFVGHIFVAAFFVNYRLVSGRWTLNTWARRLYPIVNVPSFALFGWLSATAGIYWPAGAFVFCSSAVTYIGLYTYAGYMVPSLLLYVALFAGLWLQDPAGLAETWVFHAAACLGHYLFLVYMGWNSTNQRRQNETAGRVLRQSRRDKRTIAEERKKSDRLLLNILPEKIADELKHTGANRPVHFDAATVLFTDFEGFTRIAETMAPGELIEELDRCFSYFDSLMDRYRLEKLKTIGDSFMCAGGLPEPNRTHAVDAVLAALEIQAFMDRMQSIKQAQNLPYWSLRIGIHTGPLVAGVIGEKKFAYDVWGDTVNTASRCESSGVAGRINISAETRRLVEPFFECEYRGRVAAKNKGEIEMYFVNGIKSGLRAAGEALLPNERFERLYGELQNV